jgi:hypothetical protein
VDKSSLILSAHQSVPGTLAGVSGVFVDVFKQWDEFFEEF